MSGTLYWQLLANSTGKLIGDKYLSATALFSLNLNVRNCHVIEINYKIPWEICFITNKLCHYGYKIIIVLC